MSVLLIKIVIIFISFGLGKSALAEQKCIITVDGKCSHTIHTFMFATNTEAYEACMKFGSSIRPSQIPYCHAAFYSNFIEVGWLRKPNTDTSHLGVFYFERVGDTHPKPENKGGSCANNTSHPVNITTGNKFFSYTDYNDATFSVERYYNSLSASLYDWSFNYLQEIKYNYVADEFATNASGQSYLKHEMLVNRPDGKRLRFTYNGSGYDGYSHLSAQLILLNPEFIQRLTENSHVYDRNAVGQMVMDSKLPKLQSVESLGETHALVLSDRTEYYDGRGWLVRIDPLFGSEYNFNYSTTDVDEQYQVEVIRNTRSIKMTFESDFFAKKPLNVVLPDASMIRYDYIHDYSIKNVVHVAPDDVETPLYTYEHVRAYDGFRNTLYNISKVFDGEGRKISNVTYGSNSKVVKSEGGPENSGINASTFEFGKNKTTVTNALGKKTVYEYTDINNENKITKVSGIASDNCAAANKEYIYNAQGLLVSKTDWKGNVTAFEYNNRALETKRTLAAGTPEAQVITTQWHEIFNLPLTISEPARQTINTYDAKGLLLSSEIHSLAQ